MPNGPNGSGVIGTGVQNAALLLDDFSFQNWEVPEKIGPFGGYQKWVQHDFPGGDIDLQSFGYFPVKKISWKGCFTVDPLIDTNLYNRINALKAKCQLGNEVQLIFSQYTYTVVIETFETEPELLGWQPYSITIIPRLDNQAQAGPPTAPNINSTTPLNNMALALGTAPGAQQAGLETPVLAPVPINPTLSGGVSINQQPVASLQIPTAPPAAAAADLTTFQSSLLDAIQNSGGQLSQVNSPLLQGQASQVISDVQPLMLSGDPGTAAFGQSINDQMVLINQQLNAPTTSPSAVLPNQINPDFTQLAQQYYGNAALWEQIAAVNSDANGNTFTTPRPIGIFNITIPALTVVT